jgi:hypothetical protein
MVRRRVRAVVRVCELVEDLAQLLLGHCRRAVVGMWVAGCGSGCVVSGVWVV